MTAFEPARFGAPITAAQLQRVVPAPVPEDLDDWAHRIRARIAAEDHIRDQVPAAARWLMDGPRRLEQAIGSVLGAGLLLIWVARRLSTRD